MPSFLHAGQQVNIEPTEKEGCTVFEILEIGATGALVATRWPASASKWQNQSETKSDDVVLPTR